MLKQSQDTEQEGTLTNSPLGASQETAKDVLLRRIRHYEIRIAELRTLHDALPTGLDYEQDQKLRRMFSKAAF